MVVTLFDKWQSQIEGTTNPHSERATAAADDPKS
jgi:hypothetical protein